MEETYDVVVVGGGAAGLSGALALLRARRSVLVVDAGEPRNARAGHVHNYLTREGAAPADLVATGRDEVTGYGGLVVAGRVGRVAKDGDGFTVDVDVALDAEAGAKAEIEGLTESSGLAGHGGVRTVRARRLLVATGLVDRVPEVPGLAERWGRDVLHCPYCHGWEVRDRRIGILATGPLSWHQAELWRQWSPDVVVLLHGAPGPDSEQAERLAARGIVVVDGPVVGLELADAEAPGDAPGLDAPGGDLLTAGVSSGDVLTGVQLASGESVGVDALVVAAPVAARSEVLESLGLEPVDVEFGGHVVGSRIPADATGATAVPGVWVAGNVTDVQAQVVTAAAAGLKAGAAINADLIAQETRDAVDAYRDQVRVMLAQEAWEERYRSRPALWSGRPNPQLVAEATGLTPGHALDVGCGEGADAIWLAERGWRVTAVDLSTVALERAAGHAAAAGPQLAARIEWTHADLRDQPPAAGSYDLVTAQFMHLPGPARRDLFAGLAAAVAPGGTLLIVGHHPSDLRTAAGPRLFPDMLFTAQEVADALDPGTWEVLVAETRERTGADRDGNTVTVRDAVVVAHRRAADSGTAAGTAA
ncbi:methyltransferase domain-containing protein [Kitasatospora sp. NPDC059571]|uniref:methyltransferase domain-containing protein n=1 Tax=Kitasatospora sp. NPDC059571 TaxID=3346871 RepID=UPI0036BC5552